MEFCFSISPSNEYSGLISFRMDWLDLREATGRTNTVAGNFIWAQRFVGDVIGLNLKLLRG